MTIEAPKGLEDLTKAATKFLEVNNLDPDKWHHLTLWVRKDECADVFVNGFGAPAAPARS